MIRTDIRNVSIKEKVRFNIKEFTKNNGSFYYHENSEIRNSLNAPNRKGIFLIFSSGTKKNNNSLLFIGHSNQKPGNKLHTTIKKSESFFKEKMKEENILSIKIEWFEVAENEEIWDIPKIFMLLLRNHFTKHFKKPKWNYLANIK